MLKRCIPLFFLYNSLFSGCSEDISDTIPIEIASTDKGTTPLAQEKVQYVFDEELLSAAAAFFALEQAQDAYKKLNEIEQKEKDQQALINGCYKLERYELEYKAGVEQRFWSR